MLNLNGATRLLTDIEILDNFVNHFKKVIKPESYQEIWETEIEHVQTLYMINPLKVLAIATGHDYNFVRGYIRAALNIKEDKTLKPTT
jgi:hypothetical protein